MPSSALASLVFGAWERLAQPQGADALRAAVDEAIAALESALPHIVRTPRVSRGSGLVAVCSGARGETPVVALVAAEDLQGQTWAVTPANVIESPSATCFRSKTSPISNPAA